MDCPLLWEAVQKQRNSGGAESAKLAAVQNQRNRQTEFETKKLRSTEYGTANEDSEGCNAG